jgi:hypothetical protein
MSTAIEPELMDEDSREVPSDNTALTALARGEIDIQISTAKKYPRSITKFKRSCEQLACLDEDTAASMFYKLPRGGKQIEGPSVRLAEVVGSTWTNLRYGARIVETGERFITAQGACHDLETNNAITVEIKRRITDKYGKRFNDDMIQVTGNAACAIALRQAIFKIVPFALVKDIYEKAKLTSIGKSVPISIQRAKAIDWYIKAGATEAQVLEFLGRQSVEDVSVDDLITLRGLVTAIKDGDTTIEQALNVEPPEPPKKSRSKPLDDHKPAEKSELPDILKAVAADIGKCRRVGELEQLREEIGQDPSIAEAGLLDEAHKMIAEAIARAK